MDTEQKPLDNATGTSVHFKTSCFEAILWWTMLIVAILAIPAIAIIVSISLPISDTAKVITFVASCWICTWIGMWLMRKADRK